MIQIQHFMNKKNYMGGCTKLNVTDFFYIKKPLTPVEV